MEYIKNKKEVKLIEDIRKTLECRFLDVAKNMNALSTWNAYVRSAFGVFPIQYLLDNRPWEWVRKVKKMVVADDESKKTLQKLEERWTIILQGVRNSI